ncbi:MAG: hypothetical protein AAFW89_15260, partial [Bacteroidota bacterium]
MKTVTRFAVSLLAGVLFVGLSHAQVSYSGNGESGFGGPIGGSTMSITDDGVTVTVTFTKGGGDFNDTFVLYIDNGGTGRSTIGTEVNDRADANRAAISFMEAATTEVLTFPSGFEATHAIAINTSFGGLWSIPNSGSISNNGLTFVTGLGGDGNPSSNTDASFTFSFSFSDIGLEDSSGVAFQFIGTYLNPFGGDGSLGFASNEGFGSGFPGSNIAQASATLTGSEMYTSVFVDGTAGWRMLSLPITGGAIDDISDDTAIQGVDGGSDGTAASNFYTYNSSGAYGIPGNIFSSFGDGYGFITYFYDNTDNGSSALPLTLD